MCTHVNAAAEGIFKTCGKKIQKTYKGDGNQQMLNVTMKKWLEEIRQQARSK